METTQSQAYLVIREKSDACRYWADKHGDQFGWSPRIDDAVKFDGKNALKKARKVLLQVRHGVPNKDIFLFATSSVVPLPEWLVSRKSRGWDGAR